ncbi:hypothetical protein Goshw_006694 [Gossypium schwendimanii]|uniref:RNase H type-1 domain-containing protein n=1 Tax=Gossypium schwendimanii TaxID=34291 RepID=A0A7J9LEA1_GOSSC|nr:hypothetical protein [Gossypium schwendimanii]
MGQKGCWDCDTWRARVASAATSVKVSNLIATAVFILTANKRTAHPNSPLPLKSASGIVSKNAEGIAILSYLETQKEVPSTFAAEALACRKVVQIGIEMQWLEIIIEGDSLAIIKKCQSKSQDRSQVGVYIHDIHKIIDKFNNIVFKYTLRSENGLAHILATESLKKTEEFYLLKNVSGYAEKQKIANWMREPD